MKKKTIIASTLTKKNIKKLKIYLSKNEHIKLPK
jgi:hypothetical protein